MDESDGPGVRIATARKSLGLTQTGLARLAGVSKSMVAKVETGKATASSTWMGAVARALGVDVGYLAGQHAAGTPDQAAVHRHIPDVRRSMAAWDLIDVPEDIAPPSLDELAADVEQLGTWRRRTAYGEIGAALPRVLTGLSIAAQTLAAEQDRIRAFALLTMAFRSANTLAHKLGYPDLSLTALDRMQWAAAHTDDELLVAMVDYLRAGALGRIGEPRGALRVLNRAMSAIEGRVGTDAVCRAVYGCLHMKAVTVYGALADADAVATHLAEAGDLAHGLPDRVVYETVFGPANVGLHGLGALVDLAEPGKAMRVAASIELPDDMPAERRTYFHIDRARALLLSADPDGAVEALYKARAVAPVHFQNSSTVRGTIQAVAAQAYRPPAGLRALARSVGVQA